jgi:hypothetical protein
MAEKPMSKAEKRAREMLAEMKMDAANKRAYDAADQTEPAPMVAPRPRPMPAPAQAMPQDQMGNATGMKKGGSVFRSSANGIAQRGKTRGTMVKMNSGGKC